LLGEHSDIIGIGGVDFDGLISRLENDEWLAIKVNQ
jgi:hypothetical protein